MVILSWLCCMCSPFLSSVVIHPLLLSCHPAVWCHAWGRGGAANLPLSGRRRPPCLISLPLFLVVLLQGNRNTLFSLPPPPQCNHICSVSKERAGTQRKKKHDGAPWTAAKGEKQGDIKAPPNSNTRLCVFVWRTGIKTDSPPPKHVPLLLSSFPGWLVSVLAAQCGPERLASCFPHNHVLLLRTRK